MGKNVGDINLTYGVPMGTIVAFALAEQNIPKDWLLCDGGSIPDAYSNLKTLLGNQNTPNLAGRTLIGSGTLGTTGTTYNGGDSGGEEKHCLTVEEMPKHQHYGFGEAYKDWPFGTTGDKGQKGTAGGEDSDNYFYNTSPSGGDSPHNNMPPYYVVHYIIYAGPAQEDIPR